MYPRSQLGIKWLLLLTCVACGSDTTGPSQSPLATPGVYLVTYGWAQPFFGGQVVTYDTLRVSLDSITTADAFGRGLGLDAEPEEPFGLTFWNLDAYAVHVGRANSSSRAQLRLNRRWTTCTGSVFFSFERIHPMIGCQVRRE